MKPIMKLMEWHLRPAAWTATLCAVIACGCSDDNNTRLATLDDLDWNNSNASLLLNDQRIADASAKFTTVPGSDKATLTLSGVHPSEEIEMEVTTVSDGEGGTIFRGEQTVENLRDIKVAGRFRPYGGTSGYPSTVRVVVTYTVPNDIATKEISIPINENSGFRFHYNTFSHPSKEEEDSCEFILKKINTELRKNIRNLTFKFSEDGLLTLSYATAKSDSTRSFRYWIERGDPSHSRPTMANIENSKAFFSHLLTALTPSENLIFDDFIQLAGNIPARIQIDESTGQSDGVIILGDFHYKIFPYLYTTLLTDGVWGEKEKACFGTMERAAKLCADHNDSSWISYCWAFGNSAN